MKTSKTQIIFVAALSLFVSGTAWAVGETNGRIGGTISEAQTGAPVPGATVTVSGKSLIGAPRSVTTADDGHYEIVELQSGTYDVEVSYAGVKPIRRRVSVRVGELVPLDVAWSAELAETEVTVIVEERHITRPDSTQSGTVVTNESAAKIATGRTYQGIAQTVAGVQSASGNGNPEIRGANRLSNRWMVDGLDISDPVLSTFSANINFDSLASVDVITGGMEAQYNSLGGVINLISMGGSDQWLIDSSFYINNNKFSATGQYGSQPYQGANDASLVPSPPTQSYQANLNVGGPLIKHKLWFHASFEYDYTQSSTPAGPPLNVQAPPRLSQVYLARLKLTWAPTEKDRITLSASTDPANFHNNIPSGANFRLPIAQDYQEQGGVFAIVQWDHFFNQNINSQIQTGTQYQFLNVGSMGAFPGIDQTGAEKMFSDKNWTYHFDQPQHVNTTDNTVWYQSRAIHQFSKRYMFQLDPSVSMRGKLLGSHDAKIGIQTRYQRSERDLVPNGNGESYTDAGGPGLEAGLCNPDTGEGGCFHKTVQKGYTETAQGVQIGLFLQDRWKPNKRITILPGIRFDYGQTWNRIGETASKLFGVGPRLGAVLDLTGDSKTIFAVSYGRSNDVASLLPAANGQPSPLTNTYEFNPATGKFDNLIGSQGGSAGYQFDPKATTPPHADEFTASLRRELFRDSVAGIMYTYKRISNLWDEQEINTVWDHTGYKQATSADGKPLYIDPSKPQQIYLFTTNHDLKREYQGVDFWVESRPSEHWDFYASYTLAWLYGQHSEQFDGQVGYGNVGPLYNVRQHGFFNGYLLEDIRHQLKMRVSYNTHGFDIGGTLNYTSGVPLTKQFFQYTDGGFLNLRSPIGTDPTTANDPRRFSELRTPDTVTVNLRASYDLNAILKGRNHLIVIADFFNIFNNRTPTAYNASDVANYGTVTVRQQPFKFQLGLRYLFQ
jgi:hypothetical protein